MDAALQAVCELINAHRRRHHVPELRRHSQLDQAARMHAHDMARFHYFSYIGRDGGDVGVRIRRIGHRAWTTVYALGESIAYGRPYARTVVEGWFRSPGHRANVLSGAFEETGIGWAIDDAGVPSWVQVFRKRRN